MQMTLCFLDLQLRLNVRVLKSILRIFEMVSGLKINYAKSQFGCLGKSEAWCREVALFLNCGQLDFPFSYLGIPVGSSSKSWNVWQPIISKFEVKLAKWKQRCLSVGGRISLINSVLTALPIYLLSFFRIPKKVVHKVVSIQRNFLWGGGSEATKIAWVKWDTICLPKNKGELRIKDMSKFNEALLGKWGWDLANNQNQLWARVLMSKYGGWNALCYGRNSADFSPWWKDLRSVFKQHHSNNINNNLRWKVGEGVRIKFWKDKWREGDLTLQDKYLSLYQVSTQQNHSINSMGLLVDNRWEWKFQWRRNLFDHEIDMAAAFMADIFDVQIQPSSRDLLLWRADPGGYYSIKSAYNLLKDVDSHVTEDSASKIIWSLKIPPRTSAFSWRIFKNRLPSKVNLRRRHVELPSYNCPLCDVEEETVGHVMYSCIKTRYLWWEILSWVNRVGPFPIEPRYHFMQFSHWSGKSSVDKRWQVLWVALSMTIWKHRNSLVFNNQNFSPEKVMDEALFHTWSWINCMENDFHTHFNQWSTRLKEEMS